MAAAATLTRSNVSFRRQGSSGIVWNEVSTTSPFSKTEDRTSSSVLFRSRSTGSVQYQTPAPYSQIQPPSPVEKPPAVSHKSRFRIVRWIRRLLCMLR
ncbi:hypothetical protein SUGI_0919790 [Cryptomeria japonica]|nr:hypothetical protein SUGI_0919790 [Cryptomeria japonica]